MDYTAVFLTRAYLNFSTHFFLFLLKEVAWISGGLRFFALFHLCNIDNLEMAYTCKFLLVAHWEGNH